MAVTKRLRFEILRRDNHACRYCGGVAPEVVLTIDHVVPVALGGSDDPSNLVAACKDCNSGKSATPADASLVSDVSTDALRWARAMEHAVAERLEQIEAEDTYIETFRHHWNGFTFVGNGETVELPNDWNRTLAHWFSLHMPIEIVCNAVTKAMGKRGLKGFDPEFRYMAGVVWGTLSEMQSVASLDLAQVCGDDD